ncbi:MULTISPECIES: hypothetical protein [Cyanophyceae]|uniref:Outer membrane protein beta-barrel domain-containing protein n=1 Tax=Stenomitos frigidus AS-A4 TaxID=2933935 RepID=A0ABV0KJF2_9CYAN
MSLAFFAAPAWCQYPEAAPLMLEPVETKERSKEAAVTEVGKEPQPTRLVASPMANQETDSTTTRLNTQPSTAQPVEGPQHSDLTTSQSTPLPQPAPTPNPQTPNPAATIPIDLDPALTESSPVLQRWLKQVPNVLTDIRRDPSFRTRLRLGYSQFPSTRQAGGVHLGIEDVFVGRSGLTLSADYQTAFNGTREAWGADLRYYVRPLGSIINVAPVIGYRHLATTRYTTDGVHVGLRLLLVPSRTGAADLALTQSWVAPGSEAEVGLTTLSFGYALTHNLRLSTDLQKQNSRFRSDSRVGIGLEWMF